MNLSSWLKRTISLNKTPDQSKQDLHREQQQQQQQQELFFGVTDQLIEFIKTFTVDTFKNFTLQEDEEAAAESAANVRKDLSDWQERHATLVLSKVKEISQLRYQLCPRHLKEQQFWRIYFKLVKGYVSKYELHAMQVAARRRMAEENEKSSDKAGYEVEMAEAKQTHGKASSDVD